MNAKYYCNVLLIFEMNRQVKQNEYLFMQGWARAHKAKLTLDMLKDKKQEPKLLEPHHWSTNNSDLNPVDFEI